MLGLNLHHVSKRGHKYELRLWAKLLDLFRNNISPSSKQPEHRKSAH